MPAQAEQVVNKPLSGSEVKELLKADFEKMLANTGELGDYIAYGRCGWRIVLTLQTANAYRPTTESTIEGGKELPIEDAVTSAQELERQVDSPNEERVRNGMGVPVKVKQMDGTTITEYVKYPPQPELGEGQVKTSDVSEREAEVVKKRGRPRKVS